MAVASEADPAAPIEDTLWAVSVKGMDHDRRRELALLTNWWGRHGSLVNADRLFDVVSQTSSERMRAYWSALALQRRTDPRVLSSVQLAQRHRTYRARVLIGPSQHRA